ncbi:hypothetical protein [Streptomyces sp. NPDC093589]|uniref:hypothetical protein n=1 Tax=Streptomyces sp. NPDC093589 TaxID=3366043 RepID=UPI0037FD5E34
MSGASRPHFPAAEARAELVERLRFRAATEPGCHAVADLIEAAEPPLAAAIHNQVFCVAKVDEDRQPSLYGDFARKQAAALSWPPRTKRRPKIW